MAKKAKSSAKPKAKAGKKEVKKKTVKKDTAKKNITKKNTVKKTGAKKKTGAQKTAKKLTKKVAKKAGKKTAAKKSIKKAASKKSAAKKEAPKKTAKKAVSKKTTSKVTAAKKAPASKSAPAKSKSKVTSPKVVSAPQLPPPQRVKTSRAGHRPKTERAQKGRPNTAHQMSARTAISQSTTLHPQTNAQDDGLTPSELSTAISRALGAVAAYLRDEGLYTALVSNADDAQKALRNVYTWLHSAAPLDNGVVLDEDVLRHYAQTALAGHIAQISQLFPEQADEASHFLKTDVLEFFLARMAMAEFEAL